MKNLKIFALIVVGVVILHSCTQERSNSMVHMHLQGGFTYDDVRINMDGNQVYHNDSVFTINVLSFADSDSTLQTNDNHTIGVSVNNGPFQTSNFTLNNTLYIGINLNTSDSTISYQYSDEPYVYD